MAERPGRGQAGSLAVSRMKGEFTQLFRETDYEPHVIYTLLDPDRLDCLYRKLNARLPGE